MKIIFWHGRSYSDKKTNAMIDRLEKMGCTLQTDADGRECWVYPGSIGDFVNLWDDKFIAFKRDGDWLIGITQYSSFGQR